MPSALIEPNVVGVTETRSERLGIIGAGKLGLALARVAVAAGYDVAVAGSGAADRIALQVDVLAPGASTMTTRDVVAFADTVVLALPMHRFRELPPDLFDGKVVIDAMNYWPDTDGEDPRSLKRRAAPARSCNDTSRAREW